MHSSIHRLFVVALACVVVASGASPVAAQTTSELQSNLDTMVANYNEVAGDVDLGPAGSKLRGSAVNLYIEDEETGEVTAFSFEMSQDQRITDVREGEREDADYAMTTTTSTVELLAVTDDTAAMFRNAYVQDDISIDPTYSPLEDPVGWVTFSAAEGLKGFLSDMGFF